MASRFYALDFTSITTFGFRNWGAPQCQSGSDLQCTVANFFVDREIIIPWRAKGIEHACRQYRFHAMRNIAGEIEGIADGKLVRHAINDESHLTFENVNDLLLRVSVLGHATPGRQRGDHLIHRFAVRDRTTCDAGTNLNCRIFSFHLKKLTQED